MGDRRAYRDGARSWRLVGSGGGTADVGGREGDLGLGSVERAGKGWIKGDRVVWWNRSWIRGLNYSLQTATNLTVATTWRKKTS